MQIFGDYKLYKVKVRPIYVEKIEVLYRTILIPSIYLLLSHLAVLAKQDLVSCVMPVLALRAMSPED